jgi:hypothetical protein
MDCRLIPLLDALPIWLHALWLTAAACYLAAIARALLRLACPYVPILIAVAVEIAGEQLGRPIIASTGIAANPNPSTLAIVFPIVLLLTIAAALWFSYQSTTDPSSSS